MCHGQVKESRTIRWSVKKSEKPRHINAIPYSRKEKHKGDYNQ